MPVDPISEALANCDKQQANLDAFFNVRMMAACRRTLMRLQIDLQRLGDPARGNLNFNFCGVDSWMHKTHFETTDILMIRAAEELMWFAYESVILRALKAKRTAKQVELDESAAKHPAK